MTVSALFWLLFAVVFFSLPILGTAEFSLRTANGYGFDAYRAILGDDRLIESLRLSLSVAVEVILLTLALCVPAMYWAHTRWHSLVRFVESLSMIPFVIPPIVLGGALLTLYQGSELLLDTSQFLVVAYVVVAFPFTFRLLDNGFKAVDIRTLSQAAESLGASWPTIIWRVILPNIRVAAASASFLALAVVLGEFAIANQALFFTFPVYIVTVGKSQATPAAALTVLSFGITWIAVGAVMLISHIGSISLRRTRIGGSGAVAANGFANPTSTPGEEPDRSSARRRVSGDGETGLFADAGRK